MRIGREYQEEEKNKEFKEVLKKKNASIIFSSLFQLCLTVKLVLDSNQVRTFYFKIFPYNILKHF